ncbi:aldo/keto reductase [Streptomyces sp. 8ZJF_21]|uniref:aldo/keto reductase n=1 Tax=Streptomyces sp. 8ZJF_21 TaxID=2903141 RepID=UPI0035B3CDE9
MPAFGPFETTHHAADDRYTKQEYRRTGDSGLDLPAFSFGLWQKFGTDYPYETQREIVPHAFDLGITHFDNANLYGPPHRAAEKFFGTVLRKDPAPHRDELILSTKAGNPIGPSPLTDEELALIDRHGVHGTGVRV